MATLIYNLLNGMYKAAFSLCNELSNLAFNFYYTQKDSTQIIVAVMICMFFALILFQGFTSYRLSSTVNSQVDIFLFLPQRACVQLKDAANDFSSRIHVAKCLSKE